KAGSAAMEQGGLGGGRCALEGRAPGRSESQRLRRRNVRRVWARLAGAERDVHEVRYLWEHDGVFVKFGHTRHQQLTKGRSNERPFAQLVTHSSRSKIRCLIVFPFDFPKGAPALSRQAPSVEAGYAELAPQSHVWFAL